MDRKITSAPQIMSVDRATMAMGKIRELMQSLGIKQKNASKALNLKPSQISHYLNCHREIKANNLLALLELVGVDLDRILSSRLAELSDLSGGEVESAQSKLRRLSGPKQASLLRIITLMRE